MKKIKILTIITIVGFIFILILPAFGQTTDTTTTTLVTPSQKQEKLEEKKKEKEKVKEDIKKAEEELNKLILDYEIAWADLSDTEIVLQEIQFKLSEAELELNKAQSALDSRLSGIYKNGKVQFLEVLLNSKSFEDFLSRLTLLTRIGQRDRQTLEEVSYLKEVIERQQADLSVKRQEQNRLVRELDRKKRQVEAKMNHLKELQKKIEEEIEEIKRLATVSWQNFSTKNFVFPVGQPHSYVDTWHAPRSGGRLHQGTDIFAPFNTPLYACVDGVIFQWEPVDDDLGGISLWIRGNDGHEYYYAHLSGFPPGITNGVKVKAGQIIGYNGNTGNARTTPPHLHFQIHPNGGSAINSYPILAALEGKALSADYVPPYAK